LGSSSTPTRVLGDRLLEAGRRAPALAVKSAVHTAALAGYPNERFVVKAR
jgi:hypothetical protein